jgi:glycosyltransferase involved in cell wall biosynthesis
VSCDLDLSVVVPTFNRPAAVEGLLEALAGQDYPRDRFEVVVVDDGSTPPLSGLEERWGERLNLRVIRQENRGCGPARQTGVESARGRFLAFTDDDCRPVADWLSKLARHVAAEPEAAVAGATKNAVDGSTLSEATQLVVNQLILSGHRNGGLRFAPTCNLAVPRVQLASIGGLDPNWRNGGGEDRDLCFRWISAGFPLKFEPAAEVRHHHSLTLKQFLRLHFHYGRGAWMVHHRRRRLKYEPLEFYLHLMYAPFGRFPLVFACRVAGAVFLAQLCTAAGLVAESVGRHGRG